MDMAYHLRELQTVSRVRDDKPTEAEKLAFAKKHAPTIAQLKKLTDAILADNQPAKVPTGDEEQPK